MPVTVQTSTQQLEEVLLTSWWSPMTAILSLRSPSMQTCWPQPTVITNNSGLTRVKWPSIGLTSYTVQLMRVMLARVVAQGLIQLRADGRCPDRYANKLKGTVEAILRTLLREASWTWASYLPWTKSAQAMPSAAIMRVNWIIWFTCRSKFMIRQFFTKSGTTWRQKPRLFLNKVRKDRST